MPIPRSTYRILFRRGTSDFWESANPVLSAGEPGFQTDDLRIKIGDGVTPWTELDFVGTALLEGMPNVEGPPGPQGPPGPAGPAGGGGGGGSSYIHDQIALSDTWAVVHNLGRWPSVTVVDSGGSVIFPDIRYDSYNQVTIMFGSATSGKVYLS